MYKIYTSICIYKKFIFYICIYAYTYAYIYYISSIPLFPIYLL